MGAPGDLFSLVDNGTFTAVLAPEPAALGLLAFGAVALGIMRRKSLS